VPVNLNVMLLVDIPMDINSKFKVNVWGVLGIIGTTAVVATQ